MNLRGLIQLRTSIRCQTTNMSSSMSLLLIKSSTWLFYNYTNLFYYWDLYSQDVYPFPNAKYVYLLPYILPCFWFSWSQTLGSSMVVAVFLFSSYHEVSAGKSHSTKSYLLFWEDIDKMSVECPEFSLKLIILFAFCSLWSCSSFWKSGHTTSSWPSIIIIALCNNNNRYIIALKIVLIILNSFFIN